MKGTVSIAKRIFWLLGGGNLLMLSSLNGLWAADLADWQKKQIVYEKYAEYKKEFPGVSDIMPRDAMRLQERGEAVFLDVRKGDERKVSQLPGAIGEDDFLAARARYAGKTIIAYCTIGYRSGLLVKRLATEGIKGYNLQGGILAWTLEGGRVVDKKGETRRLHIYGRQWDYAPSGYETVVFGFWQKLLNP